MGFESSGVSTPGEEQAASDNSADARRQRGVAVGDVAPLASVAGSRSGQRGDRRARRLEADRRGRATNRQRAGDRQRRGVEQRRIAREREAAEPLGLKVNADVGI